jgi:hypothetical protein
MKIFGRTCVFILPVFLAFASSLHGARLTGVMVFSCDSAGNPAGDFIWDTRGSDSDFYKVWLSPGLPGGVPDGLGAAFINGPDWAQAPIDLTLNDGEYQFTVFTEYNGPWHHFAINLFFDNRLVPGISVKAPLRTNDTVRRFKINTAPLTYSMTSYPAPDARAARSSKYRSDKRISLTDFQFVTPATFARDRVSSHSANASGRDDYIGTFTLEVSSRGQE